EDQIPDRMEHVERRRLTAPVVPEEQAPPSRPQLEIHEAAVVVDVQACDPRVHGPAPRWSYHGDRLGVRPGRASASGARAVSRGKTTSEYRFDPKNTAWVAIVAASTAAVLLASTGPVQSERPRSRAATVNAA